MKSLFILGSTGSIGVNTLEVIRLHPDRFEVIGLSAHANIELLRQQCEQFKPQFVVITDTAALKRWHDSRFTEALSKQLGREIQVYPADQLELLVQESKVTHVMAAIVGAAGLWPTLAALKAGKTVFLANKESLVLGGQFLLGACQAGNGTLLPVDSEHNAIFQCLPREFQPGDHLNWGIERLILTASGGPFLNKPLTDLETVTPGQAVAHPNWEMGRKISVDSASMANKGLELIEAYWFFGLPADRLSVLVHPESIVHSLVEYIDASVLAQMGQPDMKTPIAHVLGFPNRISSGSGRLNLAELGKLTFLEPDYKRFPMLELAFQVLQQVTVCAPVFNAANEVAVERFLGNELPYLSIYKLVKECLDQYSSHSIHSLDDAIGLDEEVRHFAQQLKV